MAGAAADKNDAKKPLGVSSDSFDASRGGTDVFSRSKMLGTEGAKFNTNTAGKHLEMPKDPNEYTILSKIEEEKEGTLDQEKLLSMYNDLQLPEYQGIQSESKKTTFMKSEQSKGTEKDDILGASAEYERQESEDLQELFKNLSLVN